MNSISHERVAVLGAGGWGTALTVILSQQKRTVHLWARRPELAWQLRESRENGDYLPGVSIPGDVCITSHLGEALTDVGLVFIAVPSVGVTELLSRLPKDKGIVLCAKGLTAQGIAFSEWAKTEGWDRVAVLSGPNHAEEIARLLPAATVVASQDKAFAKQVQSVLKAPSFRVYTSTDVTGVELGGVIKNVIALAAGMLDGLGAGDNAKAALVTRGLVEMRRYLCHQGAQEETVYGLSGLGDLVATCTSPHSRNRAAGEAIAKAENPLQGGRVVEGMRTAERIFEWSVAQNVELPIVSSVARILKGELSVRGALAEVMDRPAKPE